MSTPEGHAGGTVLRESTRGKTEVVWKEETGKA